MPISPRLVVVIAGVQNPLARRSLANSRTMLPLGHFPRAPNWQIPCQVAQKKARATMKIVNAEAIAELLSRAAASPRKRMNLNLHAEQTDTVGRFLNAGVAGTYVRPHRHRIDRWELVTALQGRFDVVIFTSDGVVKSRVILGSQGASVAEIPGGKWHSVVFHAPGAVVLEVKAGPYEPVQRRSHHYSRIIAGVRDGDVDQTAGPDRTACAVRIRYDACNGRLK